MNCTAVREQIQRLDPDSLGDLAEDWDALLNRSFDNRLFYSATWLRTWWSHFGSGDAFIVTQRDDNGRLTGLLPVQVRDGVLSLAGDYNVSDYMDALAEKGDAHAILVALWQAAIDRVDHQHLDLHHVPSTSPTLAALQQAANSRGRAIEVSEEQVCPVAILCNDWDGYLQMLTKKQRHEIRRKLRRAHEGGESSWHTVQTIDDLNRDLPTFFRLHEASAHDKARFMTGEMRAFFGAVARNALDDGTLHLSFFRRDGVDIATTMSFLYRGRFLLYNSGYDPAFSANNPGIAAVAFAMQDAIKAKAVAFDFLSGNEPYKYQFGASDTHTSRIHTIE